MKAPAARENEDVHRVCAGRLLTKALVSPAKGGPHDYPGGAKSAQHRAKLDKQWTGVRSCPGNGFMPGDVPVKPGTMKQKQSHWPRPARVRSPRETAELEVLMPDVAAICSFTRPSAKL